MTILRLMLPWELPRGPGVGVVMAMAGDDVRSKVMGLPSAWCCQIAVMSQFCIWLLKSGEGVGIMRESMKL